MPNLCTNPSNFSSFPNNCLDFGELRSSAKDSKDFLDFDFPSKGFNIILESQSSIDYESSRLEVASHPVVRNMDRLILFILSISLKNKRGPGSQDSRMCKNLQLGLGLRTCKNL